MDKWDELINRITNAALAEEPEAALMSALQLFAEFGRALEAISGDTDRLATAAEKLADQQQQEIRGPEEV